MQQVTVNMPVGLAYAYDPNYRIPNHIALINNALMDVAAKKIDRLIINMPPRHGKSELISKYFPAWFLLNHTNKRIILTSYEADFAASWGRKARDIINAFCYQYNTSIRTDNNAANRFELVQGGQLNTAGAGGAITGKGADILIVDDPVKNIDDANSKTYRDKVWDWFNTTAFTRLEPDGAVIVIMTRWHYDDLVGRIIANDKDERWKVISLPAIDDDGNALWPERFNAEKLNEIKTQLGSMHFNALYQQRPVATENQIYKPSWWQYYTELPECKYVVQSWDTAFKDKEQNDFSVCTTWGKCEKGSYLMDMVRSKLEFPALLRMVKAQAEKYNPDVILIEDKASGQSLVQTIKNETRLPIKGIQVTSDKITRAHLAVPLIESGRVFIPNSAPWLADFLNETQEFPMGKHDDIVDSMNQAILHLRTLDNTITINRSAQFKKQNYFRRGIM